MKKILIVDTETGGLDASAHSILSIAAVVFQDGAVVDQYYAIVNEGEVIITDKAALGVNGLTIERVRAEGVSPIQAVNAIRAMISKNSMRGRVTIAAHNAPFDVAFMRRLWRLAGADFDAQFSYRSLCTATGALMLDFAGRISLPGGSASLDNLVKYFGIKLDREGGHDALKDVLATAEVLKHEMRLLGSSAVR